MHEGAGDSAGFNLFVSGLRAELERQSTSPVFIYEEALDAYEERIDNSQNGHDPKHLAAHLRILAEKYQRHNIDVIVPLGPYSLQFLEKYKERFAPQSRVVYFAVGGAPSTTFPDAGFVLHFDIGPTLEIALLQNPGTRRVLFISGASLDNQKYLRLFNESIQKRAAQLKGRVEFQVIGEQETFAELRQQLAAEGPDTISIFLTYDSDSTGQYFTSVQALRALAQSASRPMYSWASIAIGSGIVGGKLVDFERAGAETGKLIHRVQTGESPESLRPVQDTVQSYVFDGRQMKRWRYGYDQLPKGSRVINRNYSAWELYRGRIITAIVVILLQALLIFNFVRNHVARARAERALAEGDELKASVLESIGTRVVVLDANGSIVAANHYWDEYLAAHGPELEKIPDTTKYFELALVLREFGILTETTVEGIRSVCEGSRDRFELEYPIGLQEDLIWVLLVVTPLNHGQGGVVITHRNISQKKEDEAAIRRLSGKLITAQETERSRIGRELHDDINQQLALLAMEAQSLTLVKDLGPEVQKRARGLWEKVTAVSSDVETLSHQLHSSKLDYLGLPNALGGLCREFTHNENIDADYRTEGEVMRLDHETSLALFRVAQEALRNISKHSHATSVQIRLVMDSATSTLEIKDNGIGFVVDQRNGNSIGMFTMRERMELVHGRLEISSLPREGTMVRAIAPTRSVQESVREIGRASKAS